MDFGQIFVAFLALIVSLTVHEAAHAWSADRLGDPTARLLGRLSLNPVVHVDPIGTLLFPLIALMTGLPLIGWAKPVPVDPRNLREPRRDFAIVAAAGPISNVLMALAGSLLLKVVTGGNELLVTGLLWFVLVNALLAVFNMIPVPPLDGGNVLMGILPLGLARGVERLRPYGFLILYALMLTGILGAITLPVRTAVLTWLL
ncbi:MAG: site-2 protease family protein [Vicinamibacterales bacterium]